MKIRTERSPDGAVECDLLGSWSPSLPSSLGPQYENGDPSALWIVGFHLRNIEFSQYRGPVFLRLSNQRKSE